MQMQTDAPGLQIFDGHITGMSGANDTDGTPVENYGGLAMEAQCWPDAPNNAHFPDTTLRPGQVWQQNTKWSFQG